METVNNILSSIGLQGMLPSIIGGALIALATTINFFFFGKITGMSSIFSGLLNGRGQQDFNKKYALAVGLITGTYGLHYVLGNTFTIWGHTIVIFDTENMKSNPSLLYFAVAGLLVGFGTKLACGCTSGHGICGLPRLSKRSIIAVLVFMSAGMFTANSFHWEPPTLSINIFDSINQYAYLVRYVYFFSLGYLIYIIARSFTKFEVCWSFIIGLLFGLGLSISGMCRRSHVLNFLRFGNKGWNPSLLVVMGTAVLINFITFNLAFRYGPLYSYEFDLPKRPVDEQLIFGSMIFGVGWGMAGICPGPAMATSLYSMKSFVFLVLMAVGSWCGDSFSAYPGKNKDA